MIDCINGRLKATWSPEQIARVPCELQMPGWRTICRWSCEKHLINGSLKVLRRKGKSHGAKETRGKYSKGKSIRKRDKSVYSRQESGHREAGTAVSGQGKSKACFAALAERKTRFYIAVKTPGRKAEAMENAIVAARSAFSLDWSRPLPATGVRSSPTGAVWKNGCIVKSILPTRIAPGRKAQLKI